jgi:hypothetical protein
VVASPDRYNGKVLSVEGIRLPGEHAVLLYSPSCKPKESVDVGIQAVFPPEWVSSPNGKQLHKQFNHRTNASVKLIGTFESGSGRYGPDAARFRFTIGEISSVKKAPGAFITGTTHGTREQTDLFLLFFRNPLRRIAYHGL